MEEWGRRREGPLEVWGQEGARHERVGPPNVYDRKTDVVKRDGVGPFTDQ